MIIGGMIQSKYGNRVSITLGGSLLCLAMLLSYWSVNNFYAFCLTFGLLNGIAVGLIYSAPLTAGCNHSFDLYIAMKWFPKNRGFANGLILLGLCFGSVIFNFVETLVINPHNEKPVLDPTGATQEYFFPAHIVQNMPKIFLIISCCFAILYIIGISLIREPNEEEMKEMNPELNEELISSNEDGMKPSEIVKYYKFWQIWSTMLAISMVNVFLSSFYKVRLNDQYSIVFRSNLH